jgi:hypothetical protein
MRQFLLKALMVTIGIGIGTSLFRLFMALAT